MDRQFLLFDNRPDETKRKYTGKIEAPIYLPSQRKPHIWVLCDDTKTMNLIREINASEVSPDEKAFLTAAAWRHAVFDYELIADYYAHATAEMQRLMERSALVIIDFDAAIENGFVRLCDDIRRQYFEEYSGDE